MEPFALSFSILRLLAPKEALLVDAVEMGLARLIILGGLGSDEIDCLLLATGLVYKK